MAKDVHLEVQNGMFYESGLKTRLYLSGGISSEWPLNVHFIEQTGVFCEFCENIKLYLRGAMSKTTMADIVNLVFSLVSFPCAGRSIKCIFDKRRSAL